MLLLPQMSKDTPSKAGASDHAVEITGNWTINSHKVTYSYTGEVPTGALEVPAEATYEYGATVPAATVPTLEGYTFSGWTGEVETMPDTNVSVTGSWTINQYSYTIHHYLKGTDIQVKADQSGTVDYGTEISVELADKYLETDLTVYAVNPIQTVTVQTGDNVVTIYYTLRLKIAAVDNSKTYGATDPELTADITGAIEGDVITYKATREEGEDADTYAISVGDIVAPEYYTIDENDISGGTFTINQKAVTITVDNAEKTYNEGNPTFAGKVEGLVNDDDLGEISYIRTGNNENVGTYTGVLTASYTANPNYAVTVVPGNFEIKKAAITIVITGAKLEADYSGKAKTVNGYEATSESTLFNKSKIVLTGAASRTETNAGTYEMGLTEERFSYNDSNITATFSVTDGELKINKLPITVTADDVTRHNYLGEVDPELTATVTGMLTSEAGKAKEMINYTLSRTPGGPDGNVVGRDYVINVTGPDEIANYTISYVPGKMIIEDGHDYLLNFAEVWNGRSKLGWYRMMKQDDAILPSKPVTAYLIKNGDNEITDPYEIIDYPFHEKIDVDGKEYTLWDTRVRGAFNPAADDKTDYYTIDLLAVYAVKNRISGSNKWLIPEDLRYKDSDLPSKSAFHRNFKVQLYDGSRTNEPLYNMLTTTEGDTWYRLTKTTIDARPAYQLEKNSEPFDKDGAPAHPETFDFTGYTITENGITYQYVGDVDPSDISDRTASYFTPEFWHIVIRDNVNNWPYLREEDKFDAPKNTLAYHRDYKAALTTASNAHYVINYMLYGTDVAVQNATDKVAAIGSTVTITAEDLQIDGYELVTDPGTISIVRDATQNVFTAYYKKILTVTAADAEKVYDGEALTQADFTVEGLTNGDAKADITVTMTGRSTITDAGTEDNTIDTVGAPAYYSVKTEKGTLTVTKRPVTFSAVSETKEYTGSTITISDLKVTETAEGVGSGPQA